MLLALCCAGAGVSAAQAQDAATRARYEDAKLDWRKGRYREAYRKFRDYRAGPYGRTVQVDYMLATSACRLPELVNGGRDLLKAILQTYSLTATSRDLIDAEILRCAPGAAGAPQVLAGTSTHNAKTFYWVDKQVPISSFPMSAVRHIAPAVLDARLTPLGDAEAAVRQAKAAAPDCQTLVGRDVVICSLSPGMGETQRAEALGQTETFVTWIRHAFEITPPAHYITVFVTPTVEDLQSFALRRHGLRVSPSTIGYAFKDDLSLVTVTPTGKMGTTLHELFHLMIRRDFGDIPQWLDEGMASLYEVSSVCGGGVVGVDNWRGEILRREWPADLTLASVVATPWFPARDGEGQATAATIAHEARVLAVARYLMLHLQDRGQLAAVLAGVRARPAEAAPAAWSQKVLTEVTGQSLAEIEQAVRRRVARRDEPPPPAWINGVIGRFGGRPCDSAREALPVEKDLPPGGEG